MVSILSCNECLTLVAHSPSASQARHLPLGGRLGCPLRLRGAQHHLPASATSLGEAHIICQRQHHFRRRGRRPRRPAGKGFIRLSPRESSRNAGERAKCGQSPLHRLAAVPLPPQGGCGEPFPPRVCAHALKYKERIFWRSERSSRKKSQKIGEKFQQTVDNSEKLW